MFITICQKNIFRLYFYDYIQYGVGEYFQFDKFYFKTIMIIIVLNRAADFSIALYIQNGICKYVF